MSNKWGTKLNEQMIIAINVHTNLCGMCCAIWYHLYNLKNVKNTHGGGQMVQKSRNASYVNVYIKFIMNLVESQFAFWL